jgi:hypothetical protein
MGPLDSIAGSYVSVECPDGDMELLLNADGSCLMEKQRWDPDRHIHTDRINRGGSWTRLAGEVHLHLGDLELRYRLASRTLGTGVASVTVRALSPLDSNPGQPFDRVALLDRAETDTFFLAAIQRGEAQPAL